MGHNKINKLIKENEQLKNTIKRLVEQIEYLKKELSQCNNKASEKSNKNKNVLICENCKEGHLKKIELYKVTELYIIWKCDNCGQIYRNLDKKVDS